MLHAILSFLAYFGTSILLLVGFVAIYVRVTPYRDFEQIARDNRAAAIVLCGAVLGFTMPLLAAIYFTASLVEMCAWSLITCIVQLLVFITLRRQAKRIEEGQVAPALLVATFSIAAGLLAAASISV